MLSRLNFKSTVLAAAVLGTMSLAAGQANAECGGRRQIYRSTYAPAPVYRYRSGYQVGPMSVPAQSFGVGSPRMWASPSYGGGMQFEAYRHSVGKP